MVVGLTGRYCAGKDIVARAFAAEGWHVIDGDALGHEALVTLAHEVIDAFGPGIEARPGVVDRKALGRIVFTDPAARGRLERIVHPHMADRARQEIARVGGNVLINAAVLHRMGLDRSCDAVICVTSPWPLRFLRAIRRDRLSFRDALARLASQDDICPPGGRVGGRILPGGRARGRIQFEGVDVDTYTVRNRGGVRALQDRAAALARRLRG